MHLHVNTQFPITLLLCNSVYWQGESFRTEFSKIVEVRSLINEEVRVMALTATATKSLREKNCETLGMAKAIVISEPLNQLNIEYRVEATIEEQFVSLF